MARARERGQDAGRVADDLLSCIPVGGGGGGGGRGGVVGGDDAAGKGRAGVAAAAGGSSSWGELLAGGTAGRVVGPEVSRKIYRTLFAAPPTNPVLSAS